MRRRSLLWSALLLLAVVPAVMLSCSTDSPSEPSPSPGTPPGTGGSGSATYNIGVSLSPSSIAAGSNNPVQVTVDVRRNDNGQRPQNGTTIVLATSAGNLGASAGGTTATLTLVGGRATISLFPPSTPGSVTVQARLENSVGTGNLSITEAETFFIARVAPNTGSPNGGETVIIEGGGFAEPARVFFAGIAAQVLSVSNSRIRAVTPTSTTNVAVGSTRSVDVSVTINVNEADQATDLLSGGFTYSRGGTTTAPRVFSVSPASGPNEGGTQVTINGEGFESPVQVFFGSGNSAAAFNGIEATVLDVSASRIVVQAPAATGFGQTNLNSLVDLLIRNLNSGFTTISSDAFKYGTNVIITALSNNQGPYQGGSIVEILGQGFDEPVAVEFGGIGQSIISVTGTQIVVRTSGVNVVDCPADGFVEAAGISVTNIESGDGVDAADLSFFYNVPRPLLVNVTPSSGPQSGGTPVTLSGSGFEDPLRAQFIKDSEVFTGNIISSSSTTVVVRSPGVPSSVFDEESCDDNGDGTIGSRYIATTFDVRIINLGTTCEDTFAGSFTYSPSDSTCRGDLAAGGGGDGGGGDGGGGGQ